MTKEEIRKELIELLHNQHIEEERLNHIVRSIGEAFTLTETKQKSLRDIINFSGFFGKQDPIGAIADALYDDAETVIKYLQEYIVRNKP